MSGKDELKRNPELDFDIQMSSPHLFASSAGPWWFNLKSFWIAMDGKIAKMTVLPVGSEHHNSLPKRIIIDDFDLREVKAPSKTNKTEN